MKTGTGPKHNKAKFKPKVVSNSKTRFGTLKTTPAKTKKNFRKSDQYGVC